MALERQGLGRDEHDVGRLVAALHLELAFVLRVLDPVGAGAVVERGGGVGLGADVARDDDAVAVGHGEVEQAAGFDGGERHGRWDGGADELVEARDGLFHGVAQCLCAEAVRGGRGGVDVLFVGEDVQEEGEGAFGVGAAVDGVVPFVVEGGGEGPLDVLEGPDVAVMHPHEGVVHEGVAVVLCE